MGMQLDRDFDHGFDILDQLCGVIGGQQGRHIFDTDGICTGILAAFCVIHVVFVGEYVAGGVGNRDLSMSAFLLGRGDSGLEVADIIQSIKNTDNINPVGNGFLDEIFQDIIGIMAVTQHILTAE